MTEMNVPEISVPMLYPKCLKQDGDVEGGRLQVAHWSDGPFSASLHLRRIDDKTVDAELELDCRNGDAWFSTGFGNDARWAVGLPTNEAHDVAAASSLEVVRLLVLDESVGRRLVVHGVHVPDHLREGALTLNVIDAESASVVPLDDCPFFVFGYTEPPSRTVALHIGGQRAIVLMGDS